ncbi:MAG: quercetin dioxygenase-like cupin family protein [Myxococcota bacterium]|jgi:quercetin dioxygenase-like cupin family protein
MHTFSESWDVWEVHPAGSEVVLCTSGSITLHQEQPDGTRSEVTIGPGEYAINAPGVWHTADASEPATAVFITSGIGTEHRPR